MVSTDIEEFRSKIHALSGEHSIELLLLLRKQGWSIAFDLAKELGIHPSTASRYLHMMYSTGILIRRRKKHATGTTFEYKLSSRNIVLSLDLADGIPNLDEISHLIKGISQIVNRLESIGVPVNPEIVGKKRAGRVLRSIIKNDQRKTRKLIEEEPLILISILEGLVDFSEKSLGKAVTRDIVVSSWGNMPPEMAESLPGYIQELIT